jgi:two-component system response regulator BaeR
MTGPILIAEDEPKIAALLRDYLQASGLAAVIEADGARVIDAVHQHQPALLLLDWMLPGRDGPSLCRELRTFSQMPVIMVTARVEEIERLIGLEAGADDYVCKPFSPREVVARVQAQLRRAAWFQAPAAAGQDDAATKPAALASLTGTATAPAAQPATGLHVDPDTLRASLHGQLLELTPAEFRLLRHLHQQPGRVYSRDQLLDALHDDGRAISDRAIDSHVRNLRRKLELANGGCDPIRSVYGVGYALEWPIEPPRAG